MDRRGFISLLSIAGLGMLTDPILAKTSAQLPYTALPKSIEHVRHGLFQSTRISHRFLPKWLSVFQPHCFLKNGVGPGEGDLFLYSFVVGNQRITITKTIQETWIAINDAITTIGENQAIDFKLNDYQVSVLKGENERESGLQTEAICFMLQGQGKLNGQTFLEGEFLHQNNACCQIELRTDNALAVLFNRC